MDMPVSTTPKRRGRPRNPEGVKSKRRAVTMKSLLIRYLLNKSKGEQFTLLDICEELQCSDNVRAHFDDMISTGRMHSVSEGAARNKHIVYASGPKPVHKSIDYLALCIKQGNLFQLFFNYQDTWTTFGLFHTGETDAENTRTTDSDTGNRWKSIVYNIWNARNKGIDYAPIGSSIGSINTILYSTRRGSLGSD
jgi:hypothetical protein